MSTSLDQKSGFTLIEALISLMAVAALYFLTGSGTFLTSKETRRALEREALETFELAERLDLGDSDSILMKAHTSKDELLAECLSQPCLEKCSKVDKWRPVSWGKIKANLITAHGEDGNIGSGFNTARGWDECPLVRIGRVIVPPFFSPTCLGRARAYWKSGESGNIIIRILIGVPSFQINKKIDYSLLLPKDPVTGTCEKASGNSCGTGRIFLVGANLKQGDFTCSLIPELGDE